MYQRNNGRTQYVPDNPPDNKGRVWMHCEEGLNMTKACLARFMQFVLRNDIELGDIFVFDRSYDYSLVCVTVRIRPEQIAEFEAVTKGKLRPPPVINLN